MPRPLVTQLVTIEPWSNQLNPTGSAALLAQIPFF